MFFSDFGMGWVVFNVLSHYLSRAAALPEDVVRACGAPLSMGGMLRV